MIHPSTAISVRVEGPTHGMNNFARAILAWIYAPNLLDSKAVCLWVRIFLKVEAAECRLCERPSRPLGQEGDFCAEFHTRFEVVSWSSLPVDTYIVQSYTLDGVAILGVQER